MYIVSCTHFLSSPARAFTFLNVPPPAFTADHNAICKQHGARRCQSNLICQPIHHFRLNPWCSPNSTFWICGWNCEACGKKCTSRCIPWRDRSGTGREPCLSKYHMWISPYEIINLVRYCFKTICILLNKITKMCTVPNVYVRNTSAYSASLWPEIADNAHIMTPI